jgi:signal transduction histidine kinase
MDNKVVLTVKDNGKGIPQNLANRIFQPFFTAKPTVGEQGWGYA